MEKKTFYYEEIFLQGQLDDIFKSIPCPIRTRTEIDQALQAWAYFQNPSIEPLSYNADIRDELLSIGETANQLWDKINRLSEDASIRLHVHLNNSPTAHVVHTLSALKKAVELSTSNKVKRGRPKEDNFRSALAQLMLIWRWAIKGKQFGTNFLQFAESPLSVVFGDNEDGQPIEELMREIRIDINKRPQEYILHYLP